MAFDGGSPGPWNSLREWIKVEVAEWSREVSSGLCDIKRSLIDSDAKNVKC